MRSLAWPHPAVNQDRRWSHRRSSATSPFANPSHHNHPQPHPLHIEKWFLTIPQKGASSLVGVSSPMAATGRFKYADMLLAYAGARDRVALRLRAIYAWSLHV